jgi:hypothetical protein
LNSRGIKVHGVSYAIAGEPAGPDVSVPGLATRSQSASVWSAFVVKRKQKRPGEPGRLNVQKCRSGFMNPSD